LPVLSLLQRVDVHQIIDFMCQLIDVALCDRFLPNNKKNLCVTETNNATGEASKPRFSVIQNKIHVSGLAGEAVMLCMEPLCVRMMQLAFFTLSFT
jgi:hypothetical protein